MVASYADVVGAIENSPRVTVGFVDGENVWAFGGGLRQGVLNYLRKSLSQQEEFNNGV
jgi:hypothetical protein